MAPRKKANTKETTIPPPTYDDALSKIRSVLSRPLNIPDTAVGAGREAYELIGRLRSGRMAVKTAMNFGALGYDALADTLHLPPISAEQITDHTDEAERYRYGLAVMLMAPTRVDTTSLYNRLSAMLSNDANREKRAANQREVSEVRSDHREATLAQEAVLKYHVQRLNNNVPSSVGLPSEWDKSFIHWRTFYRARGSFLATQSDEARGAQGSAPPKSTWTGLDSAQWEMACSNQSLPMGTAKELSDFLKEVLEAQVSTANPAMSLEKEQTYFLGEQWLINKYAKPALVGIGRYMDLRQVRTRRASRAVETQKDLGLLRRLESRPSRSRSDDRVSAIARRMSGIYVGGSDSDEEADAWDSQMLATGETRTVDEEEGSDTERDELSTAHEHAGAEGGDDESACETEEEGSESEV